MRYYDSCSLMPFRLYWVLTITFRYLPAVHGIYINKYIYIYIYLFIYLYIYIYTCRFLADKYCIEYIVKLYRKKCGIVGLNYCV